MTKALSLQFEHDGYKCYARVSYSPPMGKWVADSDIDYLGGYDILDLMILNEDDDVVAQDDSPITDKMLIREFELMDEFEGDTGQFWY